MSEKKRSKHKRKKVRFKSLEFKISTVEYAQIVRYCRKHKLTPNKFIKKSLRIYMQRFGPIMDHSPTPVGENQLTIFDAGADELPQGVMAGVNNCAKIVSPK